MVQLQENSGEFKKLNTEILAVFREEEKDDGLKKSLKRIEATFPLLKDMDSEKTKAYSREGFATYVIDPAGKVAAILPGTKKRRPGAKKILMELRQLTAK